MTTVAPTATEPTSALSTPGKPARAITSNTYWERVFAAKLTRPDGLKILAEQGNNFTKAYDVVLAQEAKRLEEETGVPF